MDATSESVMDGRPSMIKRLGLAGFLFFFVKGLLWLIVPAIAMALT